MLLNLSSRNSWLSGKEGNASSIDAHLSPFAFSYFLFSEDCIESIPENITDNNNFFYQLLSKHCLWIASRFELSISNQDFHFRGRKWELCKAPLSKPEKPLLVSFDMDSTLIAEEVVDELAREAGCYDEVSAVTEEAMRGELDFNQSLVKRVSLIVGLEQARMQVVAERLTLSPGALELVSYFKSQGIKTAILSGGFEFFARQIGSNLGIDVVHANNLQIASSKLTGKVIPPIVNAEQKAIHLDNMASEFKIDLKRTIAIGDGANDLPVMAKSGLGIAWHAKPKVAARADLAISSLGLNVIRWMWE